MHSFTDCVMGVLLGTAIWAVQVLYGAVFERWMTTPGWIGMLCLPASFGLEETLFTHPFTLALFTLFYSPARGDLPRRDPNEQARGARGRLPVL